MSTLPAAETQATVEDLQRLNRAQARLVTAVQDLSLARTLPEIQAVVRHAAREIAGADGATFVLRDGDRCHYADEDAISPLWKGQRFPMSACISGWAMLNARPAVIPDIYADPRIPADAYRPTFVKSLVMVPIRLKAPIGAIGAYWARQRAAPAAEVELLQALANTTAVAMESVQVYAELEQRIAQRTQQLEALNRELEAFSYSVSHDLRAPLRAINGFAEFLAREVEGTAGTKARGHLDRIRESAQQMGGLIDDLLQLARFARQEVRRQEVDLAAMARDTIARLRAGDPGRNVECVIAEKLPAKCDAGLFAVVLENLLSNAWKYTAKTGRARIEVGAEPPADGATVFFVRDNGAGFDPRQAEKLFTPFQRLHAPEEFPGTGVGLATVQRIVHRHGGRIWATAEIGRGATFYFTCAGATAGRREA
ncbi:MAG: ATP-binding protein [Opitutaceae bacterium]|nr:ATP-binding protein [Opitutaceae bacterium]